MPHAPSDVVILARQVPFRERDARGVRGDVEWVALAGFFVIGRVERRYVVVLYFWLFLVLALGAIGKEGEVWPAVVSGGQFKDGFVGGFA